MRKTIPQVVLYFTYLFFCSLFFYYLSISGKFPLALANADALYLPTLIKDITLHHANLSDWYLTPAPYYFPDMLIFIFIADISTNTVQMIGAYNFIQFTLFGTAILLLALSFQIKHPYLISFFLLNICMYLAWQSQSTLFNTLPFSAHHFSIAYMSLICFALYFKYLNTSNTIYLLFFAAFIALMTASDLLALVQISGCIITATIIFQALKLIELKPAIYIYISIAIATILGIAIYDLLTTHHQIDIQASHAFQEQYEALKSNHKKIFKVIKKSKLLSPLLALPIFFAIYSLHSVKGRIINRLSTNNDTLKISILGLSSWLVGVIGLSLAGLDNDRYLNATLISSIITLALLFYSKFSESTQGKASLIFLSLMLAGITFTKNIDYLQKQPASPRWVNCINNAITSNKLTTGIALYWDAKPITAYNPKNIKVAQVSRQLHPYHWITSKAWYSDQYEFAIINKTSNNINDQLDTKKLIDINGKPNTIINCESRDLWIFNNTFKTYES